MTAATVGHATLHGSLREPVLASINFLNEIAAKFPDAISLAAGAPRDEFLDDVDICAAIERYLSFRGAGAQRKLLQYAPASGLINDLIAGWLSQREGINAAPEAIVVTAGCQEAIFITLRALCAAPEDVLLTVNPCFVGVAGAARVLNIDLVGIDEQDDGICPDQVARVCARIRRSGRRPRGLYVIPDFANPSGAQLSRAARHQLLDIAAQEDLLILEDNPYGFTAPAPRAPVLKCLDRNARVIYLGTFSKICAPGARVGFAVADQRVRYGAEPGRPEPEPRYLAAELATIKSMVTVNTSALSQAFIGGMILGDLDDQISRRAAFYRQNQRTLISALDRHLPPGVSWTSPKGGFFAVLRLPFAADEWLVELSAREFGVLWTPMREFYVGNGGAHHMRVACSNLTLAEIEEGVARLARFIRAHS